MTRRVGVLLALVCAGFGSAAPPAPSQDSAEYVVAYVDRRTDGEAKTRALERALGFKSSVRYTRAFRGFAAALTAEQLERLRVDRNVGQIRPARASYVVMYRDFRAAPDADAKTSRLEARLGFTSSTRYRSVFQGFAAALDPAQLAQLDLDPQVAAVGLDPWIYLVFYGDEVEDAGAKTAALARALGFTTRLRLERLKAFSAELSHDQLRALDVDPDVRRADPNFCCVGPAPATPPLVVSEFIRSPRSPRAGDLLAVSVRVRDSIGVSVAGMLSCAATVAGRAVTRIAAVRSRTSSTCLWQIPPRAGGKLLRGWIRIRAESAVTDPGSVRRTFAVRVRR